VDSKSRIFQCVFPRRRPPKNGVFDGGVASLRAEKLALSLRARRDDFKLAVSDASSMKGVSTMQKGTKMKTFLPSPRRERVSRNEDDGLGRFDGQHGLRLNRLYCLSMEIHDLDGLGIVHILGHRKVPIRRCYTNVVWYVEHHNVLALTRSITYM
jgi:hypothetical protein